MRTIIKYCAILFINFLLLVACKEGENEQPNCQFGVIINSELFQNAPTDHMELIEAKIEGHCFHITLASGGCDGNSWEVKLISDGNILESAPPQRNILLSLKNEELCDAWITHSYTFDISSLQVDGNEVLLNLTNSGQQLSYKY